MSGAGPVEHESESTSGIEPHSQGRPPLAASAHCTTTTPDRIRRLTDSALNFVSTASNETLGACAVGLAASTYLLLGRVGLVLIGALGGVVLHATWENHYAAAQGLSEDHRTLRRKELGAEIVRRALDWRETQRSKDSTGDSPVPTKVEVSAEEHALDFAGYPEELGHALTELTDAVVRDYVNWWYQPLLPHEPVFPQDCRQILVGFIQSFSNHISRRRAADPVLDFLANSTSVLIVFLNELAAALKASQRAEVEAALETYLLYQPDSNLANVTNHDAQRHKLHLIAEDILQSFLDSKTYNCLPTRSFLTEVLAGLILEGTLEACSKPEWINGWIVYLLEETESPPVDANDAGADDAGTSSTVNDTLDDQEARALRQRRLSKAEQAMQEAVREAQRMNDMIAREDARDRSRDTSEDAVSLTATTDTGIATPTSSDEDRQPLPVKQLREAMVFDSEGNVMPSPSASPRRRQSLAPQPPTPERAPVLDVSTTPVTISDPPILSEQMVATALTLHNAAINILDLGEGNDQVPMRQKPSGDMLIQIEPSSNRFPGWMVTRQYASFEPLSETLRRIAHISGVSDFSAEYPELPQWRGYTRAAMIMNLERYLRAALQHERLAESQAMKQFLDKESGLERAPSQNKNVLENVGKGFVNVIGQGGKGIQTGFSTGGKAFQAGGKAVLGGVTGVFGAVTNVGKRPPMQSQNSFGSTPAQSRKSHEIYRQNNDLRTLTSSSPRPSSQLSRSSRASGEIDRAGYQPLNPSQEMLSLPPPPDKISDDYQGDSRVLSPTAKSVAADISRPDTPISTISSPRPISPVKGRPHQASSSRSSSLLSSRPKDTPLTEEETRITIDLFFALLTELLSLSSAWTFRLSLLTAAKSYLLRPGNAQLTSIRLLLQDSLVTALTSPTALASHIHKLRANTCPTELERASWPTSPMTEQEKDDLRQKARRLLVEKGLPPALRAVIGQAAGGEALGKVFDCLQVASVSRGLIFAIMVQGIRTAVQ